jgi:transaldolase/glucose-6-phosphate isomerase
MTQKTQWLMASASSGATVQIGAAGLDAALLIHLKRLERNEAIKRLFGKDPLLWKKDEENIKSIREGLGWLDLPGTLLPLADKFSAFASGIRDEGYTSVVLLGMGGSSLCSEVARQTFGSAPGYPVLHVLDNTEPAAILELEKKIKIEKTLFIVASKSGSTLETTCFFRYFYEKLSRKDIVNAGRNFVAITDAGTSLVELAIKYNFRKTFINSPNVGGRYSVLSDFGILPMALVGIDTKALLQSSCQMSIACSSRTTQDENPGMLLGALLGTAQQQGRDKVTFVLSQTLQSFGFWVEQLIAESTGKEGTGLIPVNGEEPGTADSYGLDRIFVHIYLESDDTKKEEQQLRLLEEAGTPVARICLETKTALGAAYYLLEIATAVAGMIIGINPFDQPNVAESKKNTNTILEEWAREGKFKEHKPVFDRDGIRIYAGNNVSPELARTGNSISDCIQAFLSQAKNHDYIALLPYFEMTPERTELLQAWREQMKSGLHEATTLLNGPRYLHSTGQLHKGGPASGLYILLLPEEGTELAIPGQKYGFATLHQAQALGDFRSLDEKDRRVICIRLGKDIDVSLASFLDKVQSPLMNNTL